jgi:hypothetical protein
MKILALIFLGTLWSFAGSLPKYLQLEKQSIQWKTPQKLMNQVVNTITIENTTPTAICGKVSSSFNINFTPSGTFTGNFIIKLWQHKVRAPYINTTNYVVSSQTATNSGSLVLNANFPSSGFDGVDTYDYFVTVSSYDNSITSASYPINVNTPVLSNLATSLVNPSTATVSLSASCSSGVISWYSRTNNNPENLIGTNSPFSTDLNPSVNYILKCSIANTQCTTSVDFKIPNTLSGATLTAANQTYYLGKFTANGVVYYDSGSQPFTIEMTPDNPDPSTSYFVYGTFYGGYGGYGATAQIIVRKSNNWEIWEHVNNAGSITKTRKYYSKQKYATLLPPCSAVYIKVTGGAEETLTIGSLCDTSGPIVCPSNLTLSSANTPTDDLSTGTTTKQASSANGGKITATNKITGNANVLYQARSIELNEGFKADNGTIFKAEVGGCL